MAVEILMVAGVIGFAVVVVCTALVCTYCGGREDEEGISSDNGKKIGRIGVNNGVAANHYVRKTNVKGNHSGIPHSNYYIGGGGCAVRGGDDIEWGGYDTGGGASSNWGECDTGGGGYDGGDPGGDSSSWGGCDTRGGGGDSSWGGGCDTGGGAGGGGCDSGGGGCDTGGGGCVSTD